MPRKTRHWGSNQLFILLLLMNCSSFSYAKTPPVISDLQPTKTSSLKISFATSNSIKPFFFTDQKSGIQYDLLDAALKLNNLTLQQIVFAPNLRAQRLLQTRKVDCIINAPQSLKGAFYTQSLIEYKNRIFHLKSANLEINTIADLEKYSLIGFQNASKYLGESFKEMVQKHQRYEEVSNQQTQVVMLFNGHAQVVVMEEKIFEYYKNLLSDRIDITEVVVNTSLLQPRPRYIACHNQNIAAQIDQAISKLKATTQYNDILNGQAKN